MALYVVQHRHPADRCPARDKQMAPMLLKHLSPANAEQFGIKIQSEAVIDGEHTLYLIVESAERDNVNRFMQPFAQAGSVEIFPASRCEAVVERGAC